MADAIDIPVNKPRQLTGVEEGEASCANLQEKLDAALEQIVEWMKRDSVQSGQLVKCQVECNRLEELLSKALNSLPVAPTLVPKLNEAIASLQKQNDELGVREVMLVAQRDAVKARIEEVCCDKCKRLLLLGDYADNLKYNSTGNGD